MATIITNKGRLINDLPLANTISDSDTLIIQTSNDSTNRTERVYFGTLKSNISNIEEDLSNYENIVSFASGQNKFTGSFYSPDDSISSFGNLKIRNSLELLSGLTLNNNLNINGGSLNISSGGIVSSGNVICNSVLQTNTLLVTGTSTFSGILYSDTINNTFDIETDTLTARISISAVSATVSNYLSAGTIVGSNIYSSGEVSGSYIKGGLLLTKDANATGSFLGDFKGDSAEISFISSDQINVTNEINCGSEINCSTFYGNIDPGFVGVLAGNVKDPSTLNTVLTTDGSVPGGTTTNARFFGTASYCLKSEQTEVVTSAVTAETAASASYLIFNSGFNNGTSSYSIKSESTISSSYSQNSSVADILSSMYVFTSSIFLVSSKTSPVFANDWLQLGTINQHPSANLSPSPIVSAPFTGSFAGYDYVDMKPILDFVSSSFTDVIPRYMLIRARLEGKAGNPNGSTTQFTSSVPHYAKLSIYPNEDGAYDNGQVSIFANPLRKQVIIPFTRNIYIPHNVSQTETFLFKIPQLDNQNEQQLYFAPFISSSVGKEDTSKANCQFSWSFSIYLDGVL